MAIVPVGGIIVGGGTIEEQAYETWVITGVEHQPSLYSGFQFNSYAAYRGQHYACGEDGIYLMNLTQEGDDDGVPVHPGVKLGPMNFGFDGLKFIRSIHVAKSRGTPKARVSSDDAESYPVLKHGVFVGERALVDKELIVELSDFEQLSHIEIVPMILPRR